MFMASVQGELLEAGLLCPPYKAMFTMLCQFLLYSKVISYMYTHTSSFASLVAQLVKNLPAMWETWV